MVVIKYCKERHDDNNPDFSVFYNKLEEYEILFI
jgi:hypothetical protein